MRITEFNYSNENQWALIESCDMFQTKHYCGGYDPIENAFCFSYYNEKEEEWFFQITLKKVKEILEDKIKFIEATR